MDKSKYQRLAAIDCADHIEKKGNFNYLSWAWAWDTLKRECPDATFEKHLFDSVPYMVGPDGYAYVKVSVTAEGETQAEVFPVLNHSNKPIQNPTSFDVNTALQRCLVKAIAMHGLGLYIYAGEDLPSDSPQPDEAAPTRLTQRVAEIAAKNITNPRQQAVELFGRLSEQDKAQFLTLSAGQAVAVMPEDKLPKALVWLKGKAV